MQPTPIETNVESEGSEVRSCRGYLSNEDIEDKGYDKLRSVRDEASNGQYEWTERRLTGIQ